MSQTNTKTFDLEYPVVYEGEPINSLTLRRPKGREIRAAQDGVGTPIVRTFQMAATLADRPFELIEELDAADIRRIDAWLTEIMGEQ